jgi:hypothetical protein
MIKRRVTLTRQQVWLNAWTSVATATNCMGPDVATKWADYCLAEYDKLFKDSVPHVFRAKEYSQVEPLELNVCQLCKTVHSVNNVCPDSFEVIE